MLNEELRFFIENQQELVAKYEGKVLVIKNQEVIGIFQTPLDAYTRTQEVHELGSFLIQPCRPGPDAYTVSIATLGVIA